LQVQECIKLRANGFLVLNVNTNDTASLWATQRCAPKACCTLYGDWAVKFDCPISFITGKAQRHKPWG